MKRFQWRYWLLFVLQRLGIIASFGLFFWLALGLSDVSEVRQLAWMVIACVVAGSASAVGVFALQYRRGDPPVRAYARLVTILICLMVPAVCASLVSGLPATDVSMKASTWRDGDTQVLRISGDMGMTLPAFVRRALWSQAPSVRLCLDTGGGDAAHGLVAALLMDLSETPVQAVVQNCESACGMLLLAADQVDARERGAGYAIGFHDLWSPEGDEAPIGSVRRMVAAYYARKGIEPSFIKRLESVLPGDMWYPNRFELRRTPIDARPMAEGQWRRECDQSH